ncbi:putative quinol monooxygenase [Edwardsiella anguillarum]|nr:putative quinol monooxygenase [Edwardsiella anguillarum]
MSVAVRYVSAVPQGETPRPKEECTMSEVRIVATLVASAGQQEAVRHAALQLVEPSRAEAGNVRYDLHQEEGQAATLVFFEIWQSPQALAQHEKAPTSPPFCRR